MEEVWRDVVGFELYFKVSNLGNIYSKRTKKILKQAKLQTGYMSFATKIGGREGKNYCFRVHRLVAQAFLEPPSMLMILDCSLKGYGEVIVMHMDDDKTNNNVKNLRWGTSKDNYDDFVSKNSDFKFCNPPKGFLHHNCKSNPEMVADVRANYKKFDQSASSRVFADRYKVSHTLILRIVHSKAH